MSAEQGQENTMGQGEEQSVGPDASAQAPVIRVERGNPTPEQLAALTVVLTAATGGGGAGGQGAAAQRRTLWTARSRFARPRPAVGPGGWRASALPR